MWVCVCVCIYGFVLIICVYCIHMFLIIYIFLSLIIDIFIALTNSREFSLYMCNDSKNLEMYKFKVIKFTNVLVCVIF